MNTQPSVPIHQPWQLPAGITSPAERWTRWAAAIASRHDRLSNRHLGLALTLARPGWLVLQHGERWRYAAWTFAPQIHLSIHRILGQQIGGLNFGPRAANDLPRGGLRPGSVLARVDSRPSVVRQAMLHPMAVGLPMLARQSGALPNADGPVQLVFARLRASTELAAPDDPAAGIRQTRVHHEVLRLRHRLADAQQRVETRPAQAILKRQPAPAPVPTWPVIGSSGDETPTTAWQSPRGPQVGAPGLTPGALPADLDIEQLTDKIVRRIDDRIVAHRERMGKVY